MLVANEYYCQSAVAAVNGFSIKQLLSEGAGDKRGQFLRMLSHEKRIIIDFHVKTKDLGLPGPEEKTQSNNNKSYFLSRYKVGIYVGIFIGK